MSRRVLGRPAKAAAGALVLGGLLGCPVAVEGSFDGVAFAPTGTAVAILDEHDVLVRDGVIVPVARGRRAKKIHLWLSSAQLDPGEDWNALPADRLAELRTRLATSDLLLVQGLDYDALGDGDELVAVDDDGRARGDFAFALAQRTVDAGELPVVGAGLGALVTVAAHAERVEDGEPRGGSLRVTLDVTRARAAGQPAGDVATGDVRLTVDLPFAPERLAESNLAIVAPIARCAANLGPFASGACADEPALPFADSRGVR